MFRREYFPSDALKIVNQSEGKLGFTGKAAHAVGSHLMKGAPGAASWDDGAKRKATAVGVSKDDFRDRFKDSPGTANSAWLGKGDMAILLCELLNSDVGQAGMGALDAGVSRVEVHYLNLKKLAGLFGGLGNVAMNMSKWVVTPERMEEVSKTFTNKAGDAIVRLVKQKIPKQVNSSVKAVDLATVHAVLDNLGGRLHLQTLFPDNETVESRACWVLGVVNVTVTFDKAGNPVQVVRPRT